MDLKYLLGLARWHSSEVCTFHFLAAWGFLVQTLGADMAPLGKSHAGVGVPRYKVEEDVHGC